MNPQVSVPAALLNHVVRYTEVSSMLTKKALDEISVHRQAQKKAADLSPAVLDHLINLKVIPANEKQAAEVMLGSHDLTLNMLKAATDKIAELLQENAQLRSKLTKQASDLGTGVDPSSVGIPGGPTAGDYNSLESPFVGEKTAFVKESDRKLRKLIGK